MAPSHPSRQPTAEQFVGALLGCGIGDALGWPFEGKGAAEIAGAGELVGAYRPARRPSRDEPWPPGSYSDDTQQTLVVAESIVALGRVDGRDVGTRLHQLWKSGQAVGIGRVFREAMERIDAGTDPADGAASDDDWNGAAMRVGPVALYDWRRRDRLVADVVASSRVTHRGSGAIGAAVAIAGAVAHALTHDRLDADALVAAIAPQVESIDPELVALLDRLPRLAGLPLADARAEIMTISGAVWRGRTDDGVSVEARPTVLASLYAALRSPQDYLGAIDTALRIGGDVDSFAAIAGTIVGAHLGASALPRPLVAGLQDADRMRRLGAELHRLSLT